jgi:hypothetical protein
LHASGHFDFLAFMQHLLLLCLTLAMLDFSIWSEVKNNPPVTASNVKNFIAVGFHKETAFFWECYSKEGKC